MPSTWTDVFNRLLSTLHIPSPFPTALAPDDLLWIHDNTAFERDGKYSAEFVASFFYNNSSEKVAAAVARIAGQIGLAEDDATAREVVSQRVEAFLNQIIVSRKVDIQVEGGGIVRMPPTGRSGISAITTAVPFGGKVKNGDVVKCKAILPQGWKVEGWGAELVEMNTFVTDAEGWAVISDIDDTIKISQVLSLPLLLRNTFAEDPHPTPNFPEFYAHLKSAFNPAFFYLSASPYNLYPFLRPFIAQNYPTGEIILRDSSWMDAMAVLQSVTTGTEEYKTDEGTKVLGQWLPNRKYLCIGDSTQKDPEAYSNLYRKFPDRVKAIWIRIVTGVDEAKEKTNNDPERFQRAFKGIPPTVWKTFSDVSELYSTVQSLQG